MKMIITDYWMPEMTGYELLKRVKVSKNIALILKHEQKGSNFCDCYRNPPS